MQDQFKRLKELLDDQNYPSVYLFKFIISLSLIRFQDIYHIIMVYYTIFKYFDVDYKRNEIPHTTPSATKHPAEINGMAG